MNTKIILSLILVVSALALARSAQQVPSNCSGEFNTQPVLE